MTRRRIFWLPAGVCVSVLVGMALFVWAGPCYQDHIEDSAEWGCQLWPVIRPDGVAACPSDFNSYEVPGAPSCRDGIGSRNIVVGTYGNMPSGRMEQVYGCQWCYIYFACEPEGPFLYGNRWTYHCSIVQRFDQGGQWCNMHSSGSMELDIG